MAMSSAERHDAGRNFFKPHAPDSDRLVFSALCARRALHSLFRLALCRTKTRPVRPVVDARSYTQIATADAHTLISRRAEVTCLCAPTAKSTNVPTCLVDAREDELCSTMYHAHNTATEPATAPKKSRRQVVGRACAGHLSLLRQVNRKGNDSRTPR